MENRVALIRGLWPESIHYAFAFPIKADKVPAGPDWLHEVKYDDYRMMLIREQYRVRFHRRCGGSSKQPVTHRSGATSGLAPLRSICW
jgi:hypothetical protein